MATEKQIAANRANARKSTGPRTPEGKARSSLNALTHGLTARRVVLPGEDRREFEAFARAVRADLRPRGAVQLLLAGRVIEAAWKLRRAGAAQQAFVARALEQYRAGLAAPADGSCGVAPARNKPAPTPASLLAGAACGDPDALPFLHLEEHGARLQRSLFSALRRLAAQRRLDAEAARLGREADSPARPAPAGNGATPHRSSAYAEPAPGPADASHN